MPQTLWAAPRRFRRWRSAPVRQPLTAFSADPAKVDSLRRGIAAMKALAAPDHRSWFFWAATHAYSQTLLAAELKRDPKLKTFDRAPPRLY